MRGETLQRPAVAAPSAPAVAAEPEPDVALLGATLALCALALAGIGVVTRVRREGEPA